MTIELKEASKVVRGITHIKPTSLVLETGHFNVLLGQTGSGKTSLIKLMAGLDPMASGQIFMDGQDVSKLTTQKRNISLVHQFFVNYPHMTVFENIASPLRVAGMAKSELFWRLHLIDVPWARLVDGQAGRGTFREVWRLQWEPEPVPQKSDY